MDDNSSREGYKLIASESKDEPLHIEQESLWNSLVEAYA
jgi:hypothetical protein